MLKCPEKGSGDWGKVLFRGSLILRVGKVEFIKEMVKLRKHLLSDSLFNWDVQLYF